MPAQLAFEGGKYEVTPEDELWLLRAVQAEGRPQERVAEALVNGFAFARAARNYRGSLMSWVRSYAQPVNPRWYLSGDLYKASAAKLTGAALDRAKQLAHAREVKHSRRQEFSPHVVAAVRLALSKRVDHDITDYAAAHVDATRKGYQPRSEPKQGENRFWTRAAGWTGYVAAGAAGGGIGVALALLAFVWLAARRA